MDRNDYDEAESQAVFVFFVFFPLPSLLLYRQCCKHKHKTICSNDVTVKKELLTVADTEVSRVVQDGRFGSISSCYSVATDAQTIQQDFEA